MAKDLTQPSGDRPPVDERRRAPSNRALTARVRFEEGWYWAEVPQLPGCFASGRTADELAEALAESVGMCLVDSHEALPAVSVSPRDGWRISIGRQGAALSA